MWQITKYLLNFLYNKLFPLIFWMPFVNPFWKPLKKSYKKDETSKQNSALTLIFWYVEDLQVRFQWNLLPKIILVILENWMSLFIFFLLTSFSFRFSRWYLPVHGDWQNAPNIFEHHVNFVNGIWPKLISNSNGRVHLLLGKKPIKFH